MFKILFFLDGEGSGVLMKPLHARAQPPRFFGEGREADYEWLTGGCMVMSGIKEEDRCVFPPPLML